MKFWAGVTDHSWFDFLSKRSPDEVNFWQPSETAPFKKLPQGTPFLMKLKKPFNHIGGVGFFAGFISLPLNIAWETFGEKNGTDSVVKLREMLTGIRRGASQRNPTIGCNLLIEPIFFPRNLWIETPPGWSSNIVRGKTYDMADADGDRLWGQVSERINGIKGFSNPLGVEKLLGIQEPAARSGKPTLIIPRLGQGSFRALVTAAYSKRCAITGESTLPVLEAAHIRAFSEDGPNIIPNGICMRSDFHKLYDCGLITITPEFRIEISHRIKDQWVNGKAYYRFHGANLSILPENINERPKAEFLNWHNENIFDRL